MSLLGKEIDLLKNYPKSKRDLGARENSKTEKDRKIARMFGQEFFDGDRSHGYGGFIYNSRFWEPVVPDFRDYWSLSAGKKILDVGCAKGFMLYDFKRIIPGIEIYGLDVSEYAIEKSMSEVKDRLLVGNAIDLPYSDNYFDAVISINTIHNLDENDCAKAIKEINRVSKKNSFITVDAYENDNQKSRDY